MAISRRKELQDVTQGLKASGSYGPPKRVARAIADGMSIVNYPMSGEPFHDVKGMKMPQKNSLQNQEEPDMAQQNKSLDKDDKQIAGAFRKLASQLFGAKGEQTNEQGGDQASTSQDDGQGGQDEVQQLTEDRVNELIDTKLQTYSTDLEDLKTRVESAETALGELANAGAAVEESAQALSAEIQDLKAYAESLDEDMKHVGQALKGAQLTVPASTANNSDGEDETPPAPAGAKDGKSHTQKSVRPKNDPISRIAARISGKN